MRKQYEIRALEEYARQILGPSEGERLDELTRKIVIEGDDPRLLQIIEFNKQLRARGEYLFAGWRIIYRYTAGEVGAAKLFNLRFRSRFTQTCGELSGTQFDEESACPRCGAGRKQIGPLLLDKVPRNSDMFLTMGGEVVVRESLKNAIVQKGLSGFNFAEVKGSASKSRYYQVWADSFIDVISCSASPEPCTRFADAPFHDENSNLCPVSPYDHNNGFEPISDVFVQADSWDGSDIVMSRNYYGRRSGVVVPQRLLFISKGTFDLLRQERIKGWTFHIPVLI